MEETPANPVSEVQDKTVGFISLHWYDTFHSSSPIGRITAMCVETSVRGNQIGGKLLEAGEQILHGKGCKVVEVTSNISRKLTHKFYIKHGYREDSIKFVKVIEGTKKPS